MISPDALDFTSTVRTGSMAPDADADTTRLRRLSRVLCSRLTFHPLIARNFDVEQVDLAVRVRRDVVFVRHQHDGLARVEVAGRLVGEQDARFVHQRSRDGDALPLTA